jgi:DNA-binding MarR family transcriptional regulator
MQRLLAAESNCTRIPFRGKHRYDTTMPALDRLSPQQDRTWALLVGVMMWLPAELDTYLERSADLSHAEYGVLRCLSLSEDREIHMSRLAATASVTPSHLSRIVGRLERRGFLTRSTEPTDARKTLARLTQAGARLVDEVEPGYVAEVRTRVFELLENRQLEQLEDLAEAILTPLRSECVDLLPPRVREDASKRVNAVFDGRASHPGSPSA